MSALITALVSYVGGDLLMLVLARLGLVGPKLAAARHLPVVLRAARRLKDALRPDEREALDATEQELFRRR